MLPKQGSMQGKPNKPFIIFSKITGYIPFWIFLRQKVFYIDKKKQGRHIKGGALVVSNHLSLWDFVTYMVLFASRTIRVVMAEVLFNGNKMVRWLAYQLGGIYLNRDNFSMESMKEILNTVNDGGVVVLFPQGRLPVDGCKFPFLPGVAMMAAKIDAPIIPTYTDGNYLNIKKRNHVIIGEPIYLHEHFDIKNKRPTKEQLTEITAFLEAKVDGLGEELHRRLEK